jgi:hypothetical protein
MINGFKNKKKFVSLYNMWIMDSSHRKRNRPILIFKERAFNNFFCEVHNKKINDIEDQSDRVQLF